MTLTTEGDRSVLAVTGEIDAYTAPQLREQLTELFDGGSYRIIIDLEGVEFMDSSGLGVLVGALKRAKEHDGSVDLVCTRPPILRVLRITGLDTVFPIHDVRPEATTP